MDKQEKKVSITGYSPSLLNQVRFGVKDEQETLFHDIERGIMFLLRGKVISVKQQKANSLVNVETYPIINGVITPRQNWVFSNLPLNEGVFYDLMGIYFASKKADGKTYSPTFVVKRAELV